jgi:hypothetical protein
LELYVLAEIGLRVFVDYGSPLLQQIAALRPHRELVTVVAGGEEEPLQSSTIYRFLMKYSHIYQPPLIVQLHETLPVWPFGPAKERAQVLLVERAVRSVGIRRQNFG